MEVKEAFEKITSSPVYQSWVSEGKEHCFLFSMFMLKENQWEAIFYDDQKEKTTSFGISDEGVRLVGKDVDLLNKSKEKPTKLDIENISITHEEITKIAEEGLQEQKMEKESMFSVLQSVNNKPCWLITFSTTQLKVVRFTIDAITKEIIDAATQDLTEMFKKHD